MTATTTLSPRVAIIGGGVAGLTAAYDLARTGSVRVQLYEASPELGGLAAGFKGRAAWDWPLEKFYHHLFTNDDAIIALTKEIGAGHLLEIHRPTTVMHYRGQNYPFDTPLRVLRFPHLSLIDKLRMGLVIAWLRYHPRPPWRRYDQLLADPWLERWMGATAYHMLWRPMLEGKFGPHYREVNLAWFWARVYKRTPQLGYYRGGFQAFVDALAAAARTAGAAIQTNTPVQRVQPRPGGGFRLHLAQKVEEFDQVLCTVGPDLMAKLTPDLPPGYLAQLKNLRSMGAVVLTLALDRRLLAQHYWVNVPKAEGLPFLALVEHTNMIDPVHYAGDHLLYIGDYLDPTHPYFEASVDEILAEFLPALPRFNPDFTPDWVTGAWVHKARYAQPVPIRGYAAMIPDLGTPLPGLYFASMSQVYPWDRGTNYAVELGRKVARLMLATPDLASHP